MCDAGDFDSGLDDTDTDQALAASLDALFGQLGSETCNDLLLVA